MNTSTYVVQPQKTYIQGEKAKPIYYGARVTNIFVYK